MGILAAVVFVILSTGNRLKGYTTGQYIFGHGMILIIRYNKCW